MVFEPPLPTPKYSLSAESLFSSNFALEYTAAKCFLNDNLFYPSITSFKKAELISATSEEKSKATYSLIFTYFLAKKWDHLKMMYTQGVFEQLDKKAPYFKDSILMFYIALKDANMPFIVQNLKNYLYQDASLKTKLELYDAITQSNFSNGGFNDFFMFYKKHEKSQTVAGLFNLIIPGAGYLYIGQIQTFITCFMVLSLLLWGFYHALKTRHFAQGFLIFSIFSGFYFGSILGAKLGTITYNQSLYRSIFDPVLKDNNLYPEQNIFYAP